MKSPEAARRRRPCDDMMRRKDHRSLALIALLSQHRLGGPFAPVDRRPRAGARSFGPLMAPPRPLPASRRQTERTSRFHAIGDNRPGRIPVLRESPPLLRTYFSMMRPVTIVQAVGAFLVGLLVAAASGDGEPGPRLGSAAAAACASVYLSYGAGMAMNDVADGDVDSMHGAKRDRAVASGAVSTAAGCAFCALLSATSLAAARLAELLLAGGPGRHHGAWRFVGWTAANTSIMAAYALGLQKVFLAKNLVCGYLACSPLIGAMLLMASGAPSGGGAAVHGKLRWLAAVGFPLQVSREILKDVEDVDVDGGVKATLPLAIGAGASRRVAFGLALAANAAMVFLPHYWRMFASRPPVYACSVAVGTVMCVTASGQPVERGQRLLKKSIFIVLLGMITSLVIQGYQSVRG